ncbi:ADP-ribosylation factor-like protein 16 isoform X3 [Anolis carolinensis]|uniref:ADP-ribosylation factor-like protein 16 isoform X3 n=1 Tax=Anolis carolinensis TaxID=28377 RepID=UPI002F2B6281
MATAAREGAMYLLLGGSGAGKTLLVKRLQKLSSKDGAKELGEPPATLPTVGTNLTDLSLGKKITVRELGGCMGPIWSSYYSDCCSVLYMIDAARPTQISSSCVQLLSLLSAEKLASVPVLIIFNKIICSEEVCHCLFLGLRDCDVPKVIRYLSFDAASSLKSLAKRKNTEMIVC